MIIDLDLNNKNILVVGAGTEGFKKAKLLFEHKCNITIISERINQFFYEYENIYNLNIIKKKIENIGFLDDFKNIFIIFATTNNKSLNKSITEKARSRGIITYSITDPMQSDIAFISTITIADSIKIAVSTLGKSPIMAKIIKRKIEDAIKNIIGKNDIENIKIQEFARNHAKSYIKEPEKRKEFLYSLIIDKEIQDLINAGMVDKAKERIINILNKWENNKAK